jgi:hypothetical protein
MAENPLKRLVVCVDGTWYTPDGIEGKLMSTGCTSNHGELTASASGSYRGNTSNVYRIYTSVKAGLVRDTRGRMINQVRSLKLRRQS